jgi:hypothetical protein
VPLVTASSRRLIVLFPGVQLLAVEPFDVDGEHLGFLLRQRHFLLMCFSKRTFKGVLEEIGRARQKAAMDIERLLFLSDNDFNDVVRKTQKVLASSV